MITKTRKAINFDLDNNLLKQNFLQKIIRMLGEILKNILKMKILFHHQYSGYVSKDDILMTDVFNLVGKLSRQYPWLKMSVMIFDVTIVGDEYNLLPIIKDET